MRKLLIAVVLASALVVLASVGAGASASNGNATAGVSPASALEGKGQHARDKRQRRRGRVRYDNVGRYAHASWKIISQWKWPEDPPVGNLTYCIQSGTADIAGTGENGAIKEALGLWDANAERLSFSEDCKSPNITFNWATGKHGDVEPFDGVGKVLAHAFPPSDGRVHFDDDETWTLEKREGSGQPIDLVTVAIHEIGHALGLDHTTDKTAVMWEFYEGSHRFLAKDDLTGLAELFKSLTD